MADTELTLVLSGHLCRPQSADLRPFWRGFVELQKKLPAGKPVRQIVAHSWNPDLAHLARTVYGPQLERHEQQACFYPEFMRQIEPPDRFERGLDRLTSTWKNVSIQSVLGNARSRARAVALMDELPSSGGQVLITRWDLGQTGGEQVNQLVADASLPEDYLYLSYFSEVDEGYADMWVLAPWHDARRFGRFDAFVLDSLAGRNCYIALFSGDGWPRACIKTRFAVWRSHPVGQRIHALISKFVLGVQNCARGNTLPQRVVRRLTLPIQRFLSQPPLTAENSCVPGFVAKAPVFPTFQALNIHALLKYFILSEGLRDRVRFLTHEDFELSAQSGQLINPQPLVLLLHEADDAAMARLLSESPLPLGTIYQMAGGSVRQHVSDGQGGWVVTTLQTVGRGTRDLMACALDAALCREEDAAPVLIMPSVDRYLGCTDWFYMNALAKFLLWSRTGYVGFASARAGKPSLDFPDLQLVRGGGAFSLHMALGTAACMRAFVDVADPDLRAVSECADRMLLEFPVVVKNGGLF
ncbi:hypothetical protein [Dechloromonas sp. ZS-1]|uniref:hypothetical protein n=1 Tax=Dechloromonas sp. ZS-1 TaxID=3138067 RepID=UPI0031FCFEB7